MPEFCAAEQYLLTQKVLVIDPECPVRQLHGMCCHLLSHLVVCCHMLTHTVVDTHKPPQQVWVLRVCMVFQIFQRLVPFVVCIELVGMLTNGAHIFCSGLSSLST